MLFGNYLRTFYALQAQSAAVAEVWLWQVGSWKAVGRLQSHSLTVTQMEFSHDDNLLLTVSRDRQFSVFTITRTGRLIIIVHRMQAYAFSPFLHYYSCCFGNFPWLKFLEFGWSGQVLNPWHTDAVKLN